MLNHLRAVGRILVSSNSSSSGVSCVLATAMIVDFGRGRRRRSDLASNIARSWTAARLVPNVLLAGQINRNLGKWGKRVDPVINGRFLHFRRIVGLEVVAEKGHHPARYPLCVLRSVPRLALPNLRHFRLAFVH